MAKFTKKFDCRGKVDFEKGVIYEEKKVDKETITVEVPLMDVLFQEFDGKKISIAVTELQEFEEEE